MTEHFKYEDMTDEELIDQLREGDRPVMDYICDKYKNLVRSKAKSMYILGGDSEISIFPFPVTHLSTGLL